MALLVLYRGYWWYIFSLPYERAAVQREAPPNSSGNLAQCVCKISLSKKVVSPMKKIDDQLLEFFIFYSNSNFYPSTCIVQKVEYFSLRRAPRAYSTINIEFISNLYIFHSLSTTTSPSKHEDHLLHQIDDFYCYSTKKSIFADFLR